MKKRGKKAVQPQENVKNLCRKKVFFVVLYKIPYEAFLIAVDIKSLKQQHGS